jgi:hypothetical protein
MALRHGWSNSFKDWKNAKPFLSDNQKWQQVKFMQDSKGLVPAQRGIYIVTISAKRLIQMPATMAFESPMYIGHTIQLQQRFGQHVLGNQTSNLCSKLSEFGTSVFFNFVVFEDFTKDQLKGIEQSLIDLFGPPLNAINSISSGFKTEPAASGVFLEEIT